MSRVGKKPIEIPSGVSVVISNGSVTVKGPKGEITRSINPEVSLRQENSTLIVVPVAKTKRTPALWGLTRAIVAHSVEGVSRGFEKKLEIEGIGYRVNLDGKDLVFALGFSHPVKFPAPAGIEFKVEKNVMTVSGFDKELVGETAAKIRALKKPEPYKGKGIHYQGEVVRRKAGKKATTGTA
ncbi:MAG: 50S ribosomal protein L6 [Candidatus Sungbacteria bacterium RIFCSPLOWO2_02_FULL_48_13b]|uniref:Large ribosomal subunit protein uL6 n=2 Tax=Candidatus Sungiibacteriota TaxID=1817917 RepID=A0A1G2LDZ9_9BACT|nr:MAG: 50S ribosomal protein L6 [Candidatus Sungbacteria bacterium RIFCSPHIGHO2_02_FULL_49_20]OHA09847.1 MAG: 50S ribosomal protein L6 [Candidatus Sungbacteria bacterium RIFCSPLOWO2_02_FULL_48_13b]